MPLLKGFNSICAVLMNCNNLKRPNVIKTLPKNKKHPDDQCPKDVFADKEKGL